MRDVCRVDPMSQRQNLAISAKPNSALQIFVTLLGRDVSRYGLKPMVSVELR